jgi:hypothetical protein
MPLQHSVHATQSCEAASSSSGSSSSAKRSSPKRGSTKAGKHKQQTVTTAATAAIADTAATAAAATAAGGTRKPAKPAVPAFAAAAAATTSSSSSSSSAVSGRNSMIVNEQDWVLVDNGRKGSTDSCCSDTDTTIATASTGIDSKGGAVSDKADVTATTAAVAGPVVECLACGRSVCMLCGK